MPQEDITREAGSPQPVLFRAAEYVRMSTDHQQYSTAQPGATRSRNTPTGAASRSSAPTPTRARAACPSTAAASLQQPDRRCRIRQHRLQPDPGLRRQPLGPVSGCGRSRRITSTSASAKASQVAYVRRAVRKRRLAGLDHRQRRQARHGRRVQPGTLGQGLRRPVPADRDGLSPGRTRRLWPAPGADRPVRRRSKANSNAASTRACRPTG